MAEISVNDIVNAFNKSQISEANGVSFAGKGLKLDTEQDAKKIVEAINNCSDLQYLNLEGNTLGIEAAKSIAGALERHEEFERALWKDMFTGRMKTEIPIALQHLGHGLLKSQARLTELDLSDNAFGPIGVQGLASLLKSPCCYALQVLKLNNNGLGIGGGKLLASALLDCYNFSKNSGKPLALRVFIAGRNRLENDGAKELANVFKAIGTLEEIQMPQNGIYHKGISALCLAIKYNKNLRLINLNDNTVGIEGAKALANVLPELPDLSTLNLGDCLIRSKGTVALAAGLYNNKKLQHLYLDANEMKLQAAIELVNSISNNSCLKVLSINGNCFGVPGIEAIKKLMKSLGKLNTLETLSDDEGEETDEEEENEVVEVDQESDNSDDQCSINEVEEEIKVPTMVISVGEFLSNPTLEYFLALGGNRENLLLDVAKKHEENYMEVSTNIVLKVASISTRCKDENLKTVLHVCDLLCRDLFSWCQKVEKTSMLNNTLLVQLGLIKSEDKKFKPSCNLEACLFALGNLVKKNYFPPSTQEVLKFFIKRDIEDGKDHLNAKTKFLAILSD